MTDPAGPDRVELRTIDTEMVDPAGSRLDRMSALELAASMNAGDKGVPEAVAAHLAEIAAVVEAAAAALAGGGRLIYVGAGTAGRLGVLDAAECPPTFDTEPWQVQGHIAGGRNALVDAVEGAEDDSAAGAALVTELHVGPGDVLVGISASGRTPYAVGAVEAARLAGATTVGLSCSAGSALGRAAEHPVEVVTGPEFVSGSTRLRAGTAQKLVLNMISTLSMVRIGKTLGNLMVDLRPTNAKLRARAVRIVSLVTGEPEQVAADLLEVAGGVKPAIITGLTGLAPDVARDELSAAGGRVREVLDAHGAVPVTEAPAPPRGRL
jgi:N-acetylmuramic acid 6-phosphate etherase